MAYLMKCRVDRVDRAAFGRLTLCEYSAMRDSNLACAPNDQSRKPILLNSSPKVACVVLNWNRWADTIECVNALKECIYPQLSLIIVDNGSTDDSLARIRSAHPKVLLLESGKNLGFAGGNNIGIRYALAHGADYVWLLNNDTTPAPDAVAALVAKALADQRFGSV